MTTAVAVREEAPAFELATYLTQLSTPAALEAQRRLAAAYDEACHALLGRNDVQRGEKGRLFKKKSAWRKLGRHFGISTSIVRTAHETLPSGEFLATVTARAVAPWGQAVEDVGSCCTDEETGRRKITVADAIATAATRATNRAISNLVAMGEVSAEELGKEPAAGVDTTVEALPDEITSTTPWPYEGKLHGVALKDWPAPMLKWAIVPGRALGDRTDEWQQAAKEELERRAAKPAGA